MEIRIFLYTQLRSRRKSRQLLTIGGETLTPNTLEKSEESDGEVKKSRKRAGEDFINQFFLPIWDFVYST